MKAFRIFVISALLAGSLICLAPATTRAADYWNGYWGWYDSTYVPYYQRSYSYGPAYSAPAYSAPAYSGPAYGYYAPPAYSYGPSYGYGYAPYGGAYYGVPGTGVGVYSAPAAVRAGPLRLGWR